MKIDRQFIIAAVLAGSLALVGCGGSTGSGSKTEPEKKDEPAKEQPAAPAPEPEPEPAPAPEPELEPAPAPEPEPEPEPEPVPEPEPEPEPAERDESNIRPEFAQAMEEYRGFYREYVDLLLLMKEDPSAPEVLLKYADLMQREVEMAKAFEEWGEGDLTTAELELYIDTNAEVMKMLAEAM